MTLASAGLIAAWIAIIVLFCSGAQMRNEIRLLRRRASQGPSTVEPDSPVGPPPGLALDGIGCWPSSIERREDLVLVFLTPTCASCYEIVDYLAEHPRRAKFVLLQPGPQALASGRGLFELTDQASLYDEMGVVVTPQFVHIVGGRVSEVGMAGNLRGVRTMVDKLSAEV